MAKPTGLAEEQRRALAQLERLRALPAERRSDPLLRLASERALHIAIEAVLDVGHHVLAGRGLPIPGTYRDVVPALVAAGILGLRARAGCAMLGRGDVVRPYRRRVAIGLACAVASASASCAQVLGYERSDGAVEPAFACAGAAPPPIDPSRSVFVRAPLLDLQTNAPVRDVRIKTCARADLDCLAPTEGADGVGPTDTGFLERRVAYGFNGYFEFTAARYVTTLVYQSPPAVADSTGIQIQLLTPVIVGQLASAANVTLDPELGHALVHIEDCLAAPRGGIHIQPRNVAEGKTLVFYVRTLVPDRTATETSPAGQSGIVNLPPGLVTVEAFFPDGKTFGAATFGVRRGALSYISITPSL